MFKSKTIYLIFFLIFLITVLLIIEKSNGSPSSNNKTQLEIQTISPQITQQNPQVNTFSIISTTTSSTPINVSASIEIIFSKPVANESLDLKISPEETILPLFDSNMTLLTIKPANVWKYNTSYSIKISPQTKSGENQPLDKVYEFNFKTIPYSGI